MNAIELTKMNVKETRRRSIKLWRSLPDCWLSWRPDKEAMCFGEMIRHVWSATAQYQQILESGRSSAGSIEFSFEREPILSVEKEIQLAEPYFEAFLHYIESLEVSEMDKKLIDRADVGFQRHLGDMLLRIAYHDAVHAGQFLQYQRMIGLNRPLIWD